MDLHSFKLRDGTMLTAPLKVPVGEGKGVGQVGYQVFLQDDVKNIVLHMEAINRASKLYFKDLHSVLHPFGGLGMAAQCMEQTLGQKFNHTFWERDTYCVEALQKLYPTCQVSKVGDSFKLLASMPKGSFDQYDLVYIDPTAMTCKKEGLWDVWAAMERDKVPYMWFVDSAISKIWLHTKTYTEFFGEAVLNIDDYFAAYDRKLRSMGLQILDLCREGTVVYGIVSACQASPEYPLPIHDLRVP